MAGLDPTMTAIDREPRLLSWMAASSAVMTMDLENFGFRQAGVLPSQLA